MQPCEYAMMHRYEDHYWWYAGLRRLLTLSFKKTSRLTSEVALLDAGCGTGANLVLFKEILNPEKLFAFDLHSSALRLTSSRNTGALLLQASVGHIPFQNDQLDIITCLDVLYIRGVSDIEALREFYRTLKPGGILLINLPAYEFLRGEHDVAVHTRHRYTAGELSQKLKFVGFKIKRITYWNMFLFPLFFLWRKIRARKKTPEDPKSDLRPLPSWLNEFLKMVLRIEEIFLTSLNLPFGTSVFAVARKN